MIFTAPFTIIIMLRLIHLLRFSLRSLERPVSSRGEDGLTTKRLVETVRRPHVVLLLVLGHVAERYVGEEATFRGQQERSWNAIAATLTSTGRNQLREPLPRLVVEVGRKELRKGLVRSHDHVIVVELQFHVV